VFDLIVRIVRGRLAVKAVGYGFNPLTRGDRGELLSNGFAFLYADARPTICRRRSVAGRNENLISRSNSQSSFFTDARRRRERAK
jgi:hypothetical protein